MFTNINVGWASPMDFLITLVFLWFLVGLAALPALGMMIMLVPINLFLVKRLGGNFGLVCENKLKFIFTFYL